MAFAALEQLLQASMGLSAKSIGPPAIARAVRERMAACHLDDPHAYLAYVGAIGAELQNLIEAVVVAETWFFRDPYAFTALGRLAHEEWLPAHPDGVLSVLSVPCSTGEEPYSIVIALIDAGVPASRIRVDAVDISARSVAKGERGVYGRNSFRGADLGFRDRHFDLTAEGYRVRDGIREPVHFEQGNLLAAGFRPGPAAYDVVFCRNVLIYFDRPTQDRAIAVLTRLLRADGVLFVAPAETALVSSHDMISTREPLAFAFRKAGVRAAIQPRTGPPPMTMRAPSRLASRPASRTTPRSRPPRSAVAAVPAVITTRAAAPLAPSADAAVDLDAASRLADRGQFAEAAERCDAHVLRWGPSATAFYLLGLVRGATGRRSDAAVNYRKALYLDPDHYDAQIQLALLMDEQGDAAGAQVLRDRTRRLEEKGKAPRD